MVMLANGYKDQVENAIRSGDAVVTQVCSVCKKYALVCDCWTLEP